MHWHDIDVVFLVAVANVGDKITANATPYISSRIQTDHLPEPEAGGSIRYTYGGTLGLYTNETPRVGRK